jgi:hypothetical protein
MLYWFGGFFAVFFLVSGFGISATEAMVIGLGAWVALGILFELALAIASRPQEVDELSALPLRPGDGRAEISLLNGIKIVPSSQDRRIGRIAEASLKPPRWRGLMLGNTPIPRRIWNLRGRVMLVSMFLGRDGRSWTDTEISGAYHALWRAAAWIEHEARRWHVTVNIALCEGYLATCENGRRGESELRVVDDPYRRSLDTFEDTRAVIAAMHAMAREQFGCDFEVAAQRLSSMSEADQVVWIVHSLSAGTSYYLGPDTEGLGGVRVAVCHVREEVESTPYLGTPFSDPVTFVHELLHAFGATDKYGTSANRFGVGQVSERDVMLLQTESLSRLRVDPLTARELGWLSDST